MPIGLHSSSPRRHDFIFTKNLTIYPILKEDENVTFKCVLTKKNPNATKESSPVSKTIGYIRGLENEPFFGEVKFHGSPELNLPGSRYIGERSSSEFFCFLVTFSTLKNVVNNKHDKIYPNSGGRFWGPILRQFYETIF